MFQFLNRYHQKHSIHPGFSFPHRFQFLNRYHQKENGVSSLPDRPGFNSSIGIIKRKTIPDLINLKKQFQFLNRYHQKFLNCEIIARQNYEFQFLNRYHQKSCAAKRGEPAFLVSIPQQVSSKGTETDFTAVKTALFQFLNRYHQKIYRFAIYN